MGPLRPCLSQPASHRRAGRCAAQSAARQATATPRRTAGPTSTGAPGNCRRRRRSCRWTLLGLVVRGSGWTSRRRPSRQQALRAGGCWTPGVTQTLDHPHCNNTSEHLPACRPSRGQDRSPCSRRPRASPIHPGRSEGVTCRGATRCCMSSTNRALSAADPCTKQRCGSVFWTHREVIVLVLVNRLPGSGGRPLRPGWRGTRHTSAPLPAPTVTAGSAREP